MGLSGAAFAHADPWGQDCCDVDVLHELKCVLVQTNYLLNAKFRLYDVNTEVSTNNFELVSVVGNKSLVKIVSENSPNFIESNTYVTEDKLDCDNDSNSHRSL
eukprot:Pgem_evm1s15094